MKNVNEFNQGLITLVGNKKTADMQAQRLAEFAANQSIEHNNADCGLRLIKVMQESKYGNVKTMVRYLTVIGQFSVDEKTNKLGFCKKDNMPLVAEKDEPIWLKFAKTEVIEYSKDDKWVQDNIAKMLKTVRNWAKDHPDKAATAQTINALAALLPQQPAPKAVEKLAA